MADSQSAGASASSQSPIDSPVTGTPNAPALKPRPMLFAFSLIVFVAWMAILVYWAIQLRHHAA